MKIGTIKQRLLALSRYERDRFFGIVLCKAFGIPSGVNKHDTTLTEKGFLTNGLLQPEMMAAVILEAMNSPLLADTRKTINPLAYLYRRHREKAKEYGLPDETGKLMINYRFLLKKFPLVDIVRVTESEFVKARENKHDYSIARFFTRVLTVLDCHQVARDV